MSITARRVYRRGDAAGFTDYKLVNGGSPTCVLSDNTSTTCTDTLADASLTTTVAGQSGAGAASTVQFFVRTAVNSAGCATPLDNALDREITSLNDFIRPASEDNCIRVTVKFNRPLPKRIVDERERGTFIGNNSTVFRLDYATPTLFDVTVDNSNVLRKSGITFNFPLPNSEFVGLAGAAPAALTAGAPSAGGSCTAGTHTWKYTNITGGQESLPSAVSAMQTCTAGNGTVALSVIAAGPSGTTARKVYRTFANDTSQYYLLTTINDNVTTVFTDNFADSALTSAIPGLEPSGPTFSRVEATPDNIYLPYGRITPTTLGATTALSYYLGGPTASAPWSSAHPSLPQAQTNAGTIVITRPNKTFKIIAALTTPAANGAIYDPASEQFSALQAAPNIPTAANGAGGFAIKRPDGKFLVVLGNATAVTNIYDPVNDTFVVGPSIPAGVVANGGMAIPNADGTFTIMQGNTTVGGGTESTTSAIYDPVRNTMTAGPTLTTGTGSGAWAIPLRNGMYKVSPGQDCATAGVTTTMNYDPRTKVFSGGPPLVTTLAGCGLVFQRADGFWQMFTGESAALGTATTNLINPDNGGSGIGTPLITNLLGEGGTIIPRPDGIFLLLNGNGLATTNLIIPFGRLPAAATLAGSPHLGEMPIGPVLSTATGPGSVAFQRPDGKYVVINGNATATTQLLDVGWYADGQYLSEHMKVPALVANSTLEWKQTADSYIKMEVRAAASQAALQRTAFTSVGRPGQSFYNAGNETWVQVEVNMRREFPTWGGNLDGVYNSGGGMVFTQRTIPMPTLYSYQINNGMDLLTLQSGGSNVLRVTSNGGIYSSQSGGFFAGGADLAENYTSTDSLEPAEVVIADPSNAAGVLRSKGQQYQADILGVVSTTPGFVAGAYTEDSYPIALVGRVPVKVSTENGEIKAGDSLTASSIPGYAMRATQAGRILGKALEELKKEDMKDCPAFGLGNLPKTKCGQVMMFVNLTDYLGVPVELVMAETIVSSNTISTNSQTGLELQADQLVTSALTSPDANIITTSSPNELSNTQQKILAFLKDLKEQKEMSGASFSEVFTDRVAAGIEVITPKLVADEVALNKITAVTGSDITIMLNDDGRFVIRDSSASSQDENTAVVSFDNQGNAFFAGTITAEKVKANQIEGLSIFANEVFAGKLEKLEGTIAGVATSSAELALSINKENKNSLDILSKDIELFKNAFRIDSSASAILDTNILGSLSVDGGLVVAGPSEFKGNVKFASQTTFHGESIFEKFVTFLTNVVFKGDVGFEGRPTFNKDTAGFAVIKEGEKQVRVSFEKEYLQPPVVTANSIWDISQEDLATLTQKEFYLLQKQDFVIAAVTTKGFTILLEEPAVVDLKFSWTALMVKDAKTHSSLRSSVQATPESEPIPSPTSTITPTSTEIPVSATPTPASDSAALF